MAKVVLQEIPAGYGSAAALQANFEAIEAALDNTVSRNGDTPNQMEADFDMNSRRILNLPFAGTNTEPVTYGQLVAMSTPVLYAPNPHTHVWADITNKPTTFAPSAHTHATAQITGLDSTLTSLDSRLDALEAAPRIFTQSATPTAEAVGDIWIW